VSASLREKYNITDEEIAENPILEFCLASGDERCIKTVLKNVRGRQRERGAKSADKEEGAEAAAERGRKGKEGAKKREGGTVGKVKMRLWQNMSVIFSAVASFMPYISPILAPITTMIARWRWPTRLPITVSEDGALIYRRKKLWPVAVEGVMYTLESLNPIEAITLTATVADVINGVYYDGAKYYILVENPEAVKRTDAVVSKLKLGDVERVKWPFEVGHMRDEWIGVALHFAVGAALMLISPLSGAAMFTAGAVAAWLTHSDSKYARPLFHAISANQNIKGSADPEAFHARATSSLPPSKVLLVWDRYPNFEKVLAKEAERRRHLARILSPAKEVEAYDLYQAYYRFRSYGINEAAYLAVGAVEVNSPELAGYRLGNPKEFPILSGDVLAFSPFRLVRPWKDTGTPIGLAESGKGRYVFCIDIDTEKSPHVLVVGATGSGKTTQAMAIAKTVSVKQGARIVAIDPHGHWLGMEGSTEYNVAKCIPPVRLYKENVDWIVDALTAAGYIASDYMRNSAKSLLYRLATQYPGTPVSKLYELVDPAGMDSIWLGALYSFETDCERDLPEEGHVVITSRGLMTDREVACTVLTLHYAISKAVKRGEPWVLRGKTAPLHHIFVVDEAHKFMPQTTGGLAIEALLAQVRKFGISMFLITQNLQDISQRALTNIGHVLVFWWGRSPIESHLLASIIQTDVTTVYKMQDLTISPDTNPNMRCYYYVGKSGKQAVKLCMPKVLLDRMMAGYVPPCGKVVRIIESRPAGQQQS